jgi:hypothetical protein
LIQNNYIFQAETTDSDGARAAEIDKLVETGNWDVSTFRCIFQCSCTPRQLRNLSLSQHLLTNQRRVVACIDKKKHYPREWLPLLLDM